jgi:hypothetical protein
MTKFVPFAALAASVFMSFGPVSAQTAPGCTDDGFCPVLGADGSVLYFNRPAGFFSTDEGQAILETLTVDEDSAVAPVMVEMRPMGMDVKPQMPVMNPVMN